MGTSARRGDPEILFTRFCVRTLVRRHRVAHSRYISTIHETEISSSERRMRLHVHKFVNCCCCCCSGTRLAVATTRWTWESELGGGSRCST